MKKLILLSIINFLLTQKIYSSDTFFPETKSLQKNIRFIVMLPDKSFSIYDIKAQILQKICEQNEVYLFNILYSRVCTYEHLEILLIDQQKSLIWQVADNFVLNNWGHDIIKGGYEPEYGQFVLSKKKFTQVLNPEEKRISGNLSYEDSSQIIISTDGRYLITCGFSGIKDSLERRWNLFSTKFLVQIGKIPCYCDKIKSFYSQDHHEGVFIFILFENGDLFQFNATNERTLQIVRPIHIEYWTTGEQVLTITPSSYFQQAILLKNECLQVCDSSLKKILRTIPRKQYEKNEDINIISFSHDDSFFLTASENCVQIWDAKKYKLLQKIVVIEKNEDEGKEGKVNQGLSIALASFSTYEKKIIVVLSNGKVIYLRTDIKIDSI